MYLILISYQLLGITGPVFVSVLFLLAFFVPALYPMAAAHLAKRKRQSGQAENGARESRSHVGHHS